MQKKKGKFEIVAGLVLVLCFAAGVHTLQAQVQARAGVRADAMGGAFVAVSNDVNGLQFCPAGLLNSIQWLQVELGHHRLFSGLNGGDIILNNVGVVCNISKEELVPVLVLPSQKVAPDTSIHRLSLGAQWQGLQFPGQNQNTFLFTAGIGLLPRRNNSIPVRETLVQVPHWVSLAVSARYIRFGYDQAYLRDPRFVNDAGELAAIENFLAAQNVDASDFAVDASLALYLSRKLQVAVSMMNLRQPNLASKSKEGGKKSKEGLLGRRYRAGMAYYLRPNLLAAMDVEKNEDAEALFGTDVNVYAGAEYEWRNSFIPLSLRGGINRNWLSAGFGLQLERFFRHDLMFNGVYQYGLQSHGLSNFRFALDYGWH